MFRKFKVQSCEDLHSGMVIYIPLIGKVLLVAAAPGFVK